MVPPGKCGSRISCRYLLYLVSFWEKITKNHIYYHFLIRISFQLKDAGFTFWMGDFMG